jgi:Domain of unknown function (DUF4407)
MSELLITLGCLWALIVALGRILLVDELKGWLSARRDQAVEEAIASLSEEDRALFEEDWRGTYAKYRDRPVSAWRCAREFTISARSFAWDRVVAEESFGFEASSTGVRPHLQPGRLQHMGVIRRLVRAAKEWTDIYFDAYDAPFPEGTLKNLAPGLRSLRSIIACSAILSGVSIFVALHDVIGSTALVAAAASIGFAISVWNMDRYLAVSMLGLKGSFVAAAPRVLLAAVMSLSVAQALAIGVFSPEINSLILRHAGHVPKAFEALQALDTLSTKYPSVLVMRWTLTVLVGAMNMAPIFVCLQAGGRRRKLQQRLIATSMALHR